MADQQETILPAPNPGVPSDPPDVKEAKVWGATVQNLAALAVICFLSWSQHWGTEITLGAIAVVLGLVSLPMLLGKKPGTLGVFSLAGKPLVAVLGALLKSNSAIVLVLPVAVAVALTMSACLPASQGGGIDWPAIGKCAPPAGDVLDLVIGILMNGDGPIINDAELAQLEDAAVKYGPEAVQCAVDYFVSRETSPGGGARTSAAIAGAATRGDDFLRRTAHQRSAR